MKDLMQPEFSFNACTQTRVSTCIKSASEECRVPGLPSRHGMLGQGDDGESSASARPDIDENNNCRHPGPVQNRY